MWSAKSRPGRRRARRRNPRFTGLPGFLDFSGPQLVAAAASAILVQQSFIGATTTWQELLQRRNAGTLDLGILRAGYLPPAGTGLTLCALMAAGTRSWLPLAAGLAAVYGMVWSYESVLPADERVNPVRALWIGAAGLPAPQGQGGGRLLPAPTEAQIIDGTSRARVLEVVR